VGGGAASRDCPGEAELLRNIALAFPKLSEQRLALGTSFGQFLLKFSNLPANDFHRIQQLLKHAHVCSLPSASGQRRCFALGRPWQSCPVSISPLNSVIRPRMTRLNRLLPASIAATPARRTQPSSSQALVMGARCAPLTSTSSERNDLL